jgi:hypothetical protein
LWQRRELTIPRHPATEGSDMTKSILAAVPLLFCLTTAPVFAEQILYCADTEVGGFKWDKSGAASVSKFTASRYIVKVEPATEYGLKQLRVITDTTADKRGW